MAFTQDFFTSRNNVADGNTRLGQKDRLWYDSITNTIRIGDGSTPGGIVVGGASSGSLPQGGTEKQILVKDSATDYDAVWRDQHPVSATLADDATPPALPLTATIQRLNYNASAISFTLADGYEGQLMYFTAVPTSGDVYYPWSINIACNGRYTNGNSETQGPIAGSWYPWGALYDSTQFSAFAIFSGGAWNFGGGVFVVGP